MKYCHYAGEGGRDWLKTTRESIPELGHLSAEKIEALVRKLCPCRVETQPCHVSDEDAWESEEPATEALPLAQQNLYENLFTSSHAVMLLIDPAVGEIVDANRAACCFYGYPRAALVGRSISDINTAPPDAINRRMKEVSEQRRHRLEFRHRLASGEIRDVEVYSSPLEQRGKTLLFSIVHDISDRKRTERALKRARIQAEDASLAKSQFLAHMSHEIRTPMTVILAALEQLRSSGIQPHQRRLLEMARTSSETLLKLINDILDISRIEARKLELRCEPFLLKEFLRSTVEMFQPKASEKNLRLMLEVSEQLPALVSGDPDRIRQVLINLIGNAVKFTERGEVRVTAVRCSAGSGICFGVEDTGIGIPAGPKEHLFETFSQIEGSRNREQEGSGLGLAISKGLVELMGGEINVESEEGKGSHFRFRIPLAEAKEVSLNTAATCRETGPPYDASQARILVVEDDPMLRHLIELILVRRNWEVTTVENGEEALSLWESVRFDLVLMDLQMPRMDGLAATRRIRELEREGHRTPIVALTAFAREDDREICLRAGMDAYVPKPIDNEALFRTIEEQLARRPR